MPGPGTFNMMGSSVTSFCSVNIPTAGTPLLLLGALARAVARAGNAPETSSDTSGAQRAAGGSARHRGALRRTWLVAPDKNRVVDAGRHGEPAAGWSTTRPTASPRARPSSPTRFDIQNLGPNDASQRAGDDEPADPGVLPELRNRSRGLGLQPRSNGHLRVDLLDFVPLTVNITADHHLQHAGAQPGRRPAAVNATITSATPDPTPGNNSGHGGDGRRKQRRADDRWPRPADDRRGRADRLLDRQWQPHLHRGCRTPSTARCG